MSILRPTFLKLAFCSLVLLASAPSFAQVKPSEALVKAREIEAQMTDDERFGLLKNLMVVNFKTGKRDERIPSHIGQLAGWTPGVPRLGVPDLLLTDAAPGSQTQALAGNCRMARLTAALRFQPAS